MSQEQMSTTKPNLSSALLDSPDKTPSPSEDLKPNESWTIIIGKRTIEVVITKKKLLAIVLATVSIGWGSGYLTKLLD